MALLSLSMEVDRTPPRDLASSRSGCLKVSESCLLLGRSTDGCRPESEGCCYTGTLTGYTNCLEEEQGAFNLLESISASFIQTDNHTHPIKTIRIRRLENDELFPYDTSVFLAWYEHSSTDPVTREDLSYIFDRVILKHECLLYADKDLLYRIFCSVSMQGLLFRELVRVGSVDQYSSLHVLPLRVCIDPKSLEESGYLWNMDCEEADRLLATKPCKTWVIRRSSPRNRETLMKNAELVTISRRNMRPLVESPLEAAFDNALSRPQADSTDIPQNKHSKQNPVSHSRYLHVIGVGWYCASRKIDKATSFLQFVTENNMKMEPAHSCFIDLIESYRKANKLDYSNLLIHTNHH